MTCLERPQVLKRGGDAVVALDVCFRRRTPPSALADLGRGRRFRRPLQLVVHEQRGTQTKGEDPRPTEEALFPLAEDKVEDWMVSGGTLRPENASTSTCHTGRRKLRPPKHNPIRLWSMFSYQYSETRRSPQNSEVVLPFSAATRRLKVPSQA